MLLRLERQRDESGDSWKSQKGLPYRHDEKLRIFANSIDNAIGTSSAFEMPTEKLPRNFLVVMCVARATAYLVMPPRDVMTFFVRLLKTKEGTRMFVKLCNTTIVVFLVIVAGCDLESAFVTGSGTMTVCPDPPRFEPYDACDSEGKTTNPLYGSCWTERCSDGERSLFKKIEGVPCVYEAESGVMSIGGCNDNGDCGPVVIP